MTASTMTREIRNDLANEAIEASPRCSARMAELLATRDVARIRAIRPKIAGNALQERWSTRSAISAEVARRLRNLYHA
jgi:hypothetical protein